MDGITEEMLVKNQYGFQECFKRFDKNKNGQISIKDCEQVLTSIFGELPKRTIQMMVKYADLNGDGQINYGEFTDIMKQKIRRNNFLKEFHLLDTNGDGKISANEVKTVIKKVGKVEKTDAEIHKIIKDVDDNGDGYLDYNEFLNVMEK